MWEAVFLFQDARVILAQEELRNELCNGEGEPPLRVGLFFTVQSDVCLMKELKPQELQMKWCFEKDKTSLPMNVLSECGYVHGLKLSGLRETLDISQMWILNLVKDRLLNLNTLFISKCMFM